MKKMNVDRRTDGAQTSENRITWAVILLGTITIIGQIVGQFFGFDLKVDIDGILMLITGGGAAYALSRTGVKMASSYAEGKAAERHHAPAPDGPDSESGRLMR